MIDWVYVRNIRYRPVVSTQYSLEYIVELVKGDWPGEKEIVELITGNYSYLSAAVINAGNNKIVSVDV